VAQFWRTRLSLCANSGHCLTLAAEGAAPTDSIRKAHAAINFPYDSITEVRRVTGADMRIPQPAKAQKRRAE